MLICLGAAIVRGNNCLERNPHRVVLAEPLNSSTARWRSQ